MILYLAPTVADPPILEPASPCQNCLVDISAIRVMEQISLSANTNTTQCTSPTYHNDLMRYTSDCSVHPTVLQSKRFVSIRTSKSIPP